MNKPNWSLDTWYCILTMKMQQLGTECWHWLEDLHKLSGLVCLYSTYRFQNPLIDLIHTPIHTEIRRTRACPQLRQISLWLTSVSKGECRWVGVWSSQAVSFLCLLPISSPGTVQWPIQHRTYLTYDTKADMQTINFILAYEWWTSSRTFFSRVPIYLA